MKNVINYYYDLDVTQIKKRKNNFIFNIEKEVFELIDFEGDINRIIEIYSMLKSLNVTMDEIIINKDNSIITKYENKNYILLRKCNRYMVELNLAFVIKYDIMLPLKNNLLWKNLWREKIDYYELQIAEKNLQNSLLGDSFFYYLGLNELAINLLNYVNPKNVISYVSHKRLDKIDDIFNPLNIIVDSRIRDIAEYIKNKFFNESLKADELSYLIEGINFSNDEVILLLSRLIYPSYYLDAYEKVCFAKSKVTELNKITKKNAEYEAFLKKIYNKLKKIYNVPAIEFFEN